MSRKILLSLLLTAALAGPALAQSDPPLLVGRISSLQGQVTVLGNDGVANVALLNWPVTSANHVTTTRGARAEFRVGSAAIRLDGDSDMEVTELDDDRLRLRLNYGSANVRIKTDELLRGFELTTPQARITLNEPTSVRIDTERVADTTSIGVLSGAAQVDGAGTIVTLRSGKGVDVTPDDVRTGQLRRDGFDDWAQARDRGDDSAVASRYLPPDVTGYEELDRNGSWVDNSEYGPLWTPNSVAVDWAPYRDGRWIWLDPWGWTWVDSAPWGYAPSHYGRWVMVGQRWRWAPGRGLGRPVWSPALVGWVGGGDVAFGRGHAPGMGWYPLSPREAYVPTYRVSIDVERRLAWSHDGRTIERFDEHRDHRDGVTVLPREQFEARRMVPVTAGQRAVLTPGAARNLPAMTAVPSPGGVARSSDGRHPDWRDAPRAGQPAPGAPAGAAPAGGRVLTADPYRGVRPATPSQPAAAAPGGASMQPGQQRDPYRDERGNRAAEDARWARPAPGAEIPMRGAPAQQQQQPGPATTYQQPSRPQVSQTVPSQPAAATPLPHQAQQQQAQPQQMQQQIQQQTQQLNREPHPNAEAHRDPAADKRKEEERRKNEERNGDKNQSR